MSRLKTRFILMFILVLFLSSGLALGMSWLITDLLLANVPAVRAALISRTLNQMLTLIYSLLIASLMIILLTRRMLKPLDRLTRATQEVINGNFDVNVPENPRQDELSRLERNFNKMVRELKGNLYLRKDFTNSISHEFRTPLSTITAYARLIQSGNISDDERREYADIILQESSRLTGLTSSILRLSKLDNQTIPENTREFSLDEQIRQVIMMLEPQWSKKNIELDVDMDECRICTEEELLRQVWQNLIGNAVKFTGESGVISVTLRYTDKAIIIKMTDNGIGMTEETMGKIFNQFYQGEPLSNSEGNGLGLTIVKRILDICGGEIFVDSKKGQGSSFTVKLPVV